MANLVDKFNSVIRPGQIVYDMRYERLSQIQVAFYSQTYGEYFIRIPNFYHVPAKWLFKPPGKFETHHWCFDTEISYG